MSEHLLNVDGLSSARNGRELLRQVNLRMQPGEVHGLLRLNGSGKSSLAYALMGCAGYEPDGGRIEFADQDNTHRSITERARLGLTLAWQEPARFEGLPTGAYLAIAAGGADENRLRGALQAVALPPVAYRKRPVDRTLSGGERKRIELAAVFAMRPRLAILDEPDSGVDILSLSDISALIRRMAGSGTSVLLITHCDEMISAADSASLMFRGSVVFHGAPDEVRGYYGKRCRLHSETSGDQPWQAASEREEVIA